MNFGIGGLFKSGGLGLLLYCPVGGFLGIFG